MKTQHLFFGTLFAATTMFTSCTEDAMLGGVLPEPITQTEYVQGKSANWIILQARQYTEIQQPPCENVLQPFTSDNPEVADQPANKCYGAYGLTSDEGQGFADALGRFTSKVSLKYDPTTDEFKGYISYKFFQTEDELMLGIKGKYETHQTIEGTELHVTAKYIDGTGQFEDCGFQGTLILVQANEIFNGDHLGYPATIIVEGSLLR